MKPGFAAVSITALLSTGLWSQSTPLTFEVATIKPSSGDMHRVMIQMPPGGGLRMTGVTLKMLITQAYDVRDFQISGGPGWMSSDRYDITAKSERAANEEPPPDDPRKISLEQLKSNQAQARERLRALLADRFQLKIHRETKEAPVYVLLVGKNGSKLQEAQQGGPMLRMGRGQLSGKGAELEMLANTLSNQLGRPVIDRTGLAGKFDFDLNWTPDPGQGFGPFGPPPPGVDFGPPPDPNGPSIFTAVQEQLGLRLESQKGPVDLIVIDSVEKPSEN